MNGDSFITYTDSRKPHQHGVISYRTTPNQRSQMTDHTCGGSLWWGNKFRTAPKQVYNLQLAVPYGSKVESSLCHWQ